MLADKFILFVTLISIVSCNEEDTIVDLKNGKIKGRIGETEVEKKPFFAFQSIPYAEPPVGDLRFMPPVPVKNWEGVLNTTEDKAICLQPTSEPLANEDCLYLNVYTPSLNAQANLPVMVWVYGGGFFTGNSKFSHYGPDHLLEQDVIMVSFNYRMGVFGFYSTEDEVAPGNAGLKDGVLALKWVQENIGNFGGNPENVTLFGQSAGAAVVSYLMQTPITKGLFQRAILQSGSSLNLWALARDKRRAAFETGKLLGIQTNDSSVLLEEIRKIPAQTLMYSSLITDVVIMALKNPLNGLLFSPSIEPISDTAIITEKSYGKIERGDFHRVPTMIGFTSLEALFIYNSIIPIRAYMAALTLNPSEFSPIDMNIESTETKQELGKMISEFYNVTNSLTATDYNILKFITDDQFIRPIDKTADLQSRFAPVYHYEYTYEGDLVTNHDIPGASHGDEVLYLLVNNHRIPVTERDILNKNRLVKMWTNFAKTSNPTPTQDSVLQNIIWPQLDATKHNYLEIGDDLIIRTHPENSSITFWEELYEKYGNPPYDTY